MGRRQLRLSAHAAVAIIAQQRRHAYMCLLVDKQDRARINRAQYAPAIFPTGGWRKRPQTSVWATQPSRTPCASRSLAAATPRCALNAYAHADVAMRVQTSKGARSRAGWCRIVLGPLACMPPAHGTASFQPQNANRQPPTTRPWLCCTAVRGALQRGGQARGHPDVGPGRGPAVQACAGR